MKKLMAGIICLLPLAAYADFAVDGNTIQPACVGLFNQQHSPYPVIVGIDVDGCQRSNVIPHMAKADDHRVYFLYQGQDGSATDGYYGYEVIGQAANGTYVLHTYSQLPGMTEVRDALLFVQLTQQKIKMYVSSSKPTREKGTKMLLVGYMPGGDRCSGGIQSATLKNSVLTVKKYPAINSVSQCEGAQTLTIDLGD
jgi:hypothetical protein